MNCALPGQSDLSAMLERAVKILGPLTGIADPGPPATAYLRAGRWLLEQRLDPGPEYSGFKQSVYRAVDPAFAPVFERVSNRVLLAQLQWGGVPFAGIRELNNPVRRKIADLGWLDRVRPAELLLGAVLDGEAVAYPVRILGRHELANDVLAGRPVALAYCTLCRSAMLFDRRVDGQILEFQTSGLLLDSNKVMIDRQTGSLWRQLTGEAFAGPLTGSRLQSLAVETTTWADWTAAQPTTDILELPEPWLTNSPDGPILASYLYSPDAVQPQYYASDALWFPTLGTPGRLTAKTEVIGIEADGNALAVELAALRREGTTVLAVGGSTVVVVPTAAGARVYDATGTGISEGDRITLRSRPTGGDEPAELSDGRKLPRLQGTQSFWFAWYATRPTTKWWPGG